MQGIYSPAKFELPRPRISDLKKRSNKDYTYFDQEDVERALDFGRPDILLVHDWPARIIPFEDRGQIRTTTPQPKLHKCRQRVRASADGPAGAEARAVRAYAQKVSQSSHDKIRGAAVDVCCLANVERGEDSVAFFRIADDGTIEEVVE